MRDLRTPGRFRRRLSALCGCLLSWSAASVAVASPPGGEHSGMEGLKLLSVGLPTDPVSAALVLLHRKDEDATELLLQRANKSDTMVDSATRTAMVFALAEHLESGSKDRVVRALLDLLVLDTNPKAPRQLAARPSRAQRSAALALARSADPVALRVLIAHAAHVVEPDQPETPLVAACRMALRIYPPSLDAQASLGSLIAPAVLSRALLQSSMSVERERIQWVREAKNLTPARLLKLARDDDLRVALELVRRVGKHLPPETRSARGWKEPMRREPAMALRVLALLVAVAPKSSDLHLRSFLKKQALRQAHDENAVLRSAAVWSLAVVAPRQAAQLFASRDLVTLAALLRQAHDPELATAALAFADSTDQDSLDELAREAAWINPEMMSGASTSQLRMAMKFAQLRSVAALAKRYSSSPRRGSSPGLREVSSWLEDENPKVRAAAASALGASEDASTLGLLEQAYFREEDSKARRALVASLHRLAPGSPFLKRVSELDGDSGCRAHSLGRRDPGALGVAITQVKEKTSGPMIVTLQTRRGLQIRGMAAPDGFFAVAYEDL